MKCTLIAIGLLATTSLALPAFARGGLHLLDPAWNPQHISGLPAEVRNAVAHMCRDSQADHQFVRYSQNLRIIVLHFEHFRCGDARAPCTRAGCLHQVYTSTGGRYQRQRSSSWGKFAMNDPNALPVTIRPFNSRANADVTRATVLRDRPSPLGSGCSAISLSNPSHRAVKRNWRE
jgi:hypothetical protein